MAFVSTACQVAMGLGMYHTYGVCCTTEGAVISPGGLTKPSDGFVSHH